MGLFYYLSAGLLTLTEAGCKGPPERKSGLEGYTAGRLKDAELPSSSSVARPQAKVREYLLA